MARTRFAVVGVGTMGIHHARSCAEKGGRDLCLTAVCDSDKELAAEAGGRFSVPQFSDAQKLYESGLCDAVIIATPHYWHGPLAIQAARAGLHVLCEKPVSSTVGAARAMIAECEKRGVALGVMLQYRTRGIMTKAKQLVDAGQLGEVFRVQLIASTWFRTQRYYDSGAWRGTWDGEGGGVLINQAPHHLDLFQWLGGMPKRATAVLSTRAHRIEVEDTANVLFDYGGGKMGYLYATTAEQPGYEQIMLSGEKATLVIQDNKLRLGRLKTPVGEHIMGCGRAWPGPADQKTTWREVKYPQGGGDHTSVIRAFARHIQRGSAPVATGREGINELELSNAAYISGFKHKSVDIPVDAGEMERLMDKLVRECSSGRGGQMRTAAQEKLRKLLREN